MNDARSWIERLGLRHHPEGGYFRETYRSADRIGPDGLPPRYDGPRAAATSILFLLTDRESSSLHRLKSDEVWHFHAGGPLTVHVLDPSGAYQPLRMGPDIGSGQSFQVVVPAGCWFGATVDEPGGFALVGCTVSPGFEFQDFELARRADLLRLYPQHAALITRLTRDA